MSQFLKRLPHYVSFFSHLSQIYKLGETVSHFDKIPERTLKMVSHSTVAKGYDLVETKSPATVKTWLRPDLDIVKSR